MKMAPKFAPWRSASGCTGPGSGAKALMKYLLDKFSNTSNWGIYNCRPPSLHAEGRALDVGVPLNNRKYGDAIVNALLDAGPSKLGICSIIFRRKIYSAKSPNGRWMEDRGSNTANHEDHVHIGMTRKAARELSLATIRSVLSNTQGTDEYEEYRKNVRAGSRTIKRGSAGYDVKELQRILNAWYPGLTPLTRDGYYGPKTEARVKYMQDRANIKVDGITGPQTWRTLKVI